LVEKHAFPEIIASEVIACEDALEELMGRVDVNEIFSTIFSKFCIGK
jgi:tRNA U34 5-carboxymethylaminomethyl modifying GTPase MnmE/TrmE